MFLWSKLSSAQWLDAWEERFAGKANLVVEYLKGGKSLRIKLFCPTEKEALAVKEQFGGSLRKIVEADWMSIVTMPRPVKVRDVFLVTAETNEETLKQLQQEHPKRQLIIIPPEMAFGTGDHATTSTCLRLLVDEASKRKQTTWTMADLGTGTGVLAIAAKKLGCDTCYACDFDPFSVAATERNLKRNHISEVEVAEQDVLQWQVPKGGYDVVVANLFSTVLIEAWPVISLSIAPKGTLIVSGILATQAWDVFLAAAAQGIGFTKVIKKGKWVTALGGRMADLIEQKS